MKRKTVPEAVAVKVAQVPVVYHVPALMMQPTEFPPVVTIKYPLPVKGVPGVLVAVDVAAAVVLVTGEPLFGRYCTPDAGQSDAAPTSFGQYGCGE